MHEGPIFYNVVTALQLTYFIEKEPNSYKTVFSHSIAVEFQSLCEGYLVIVWAADKCTQLCKHIFLQMNKLISYKTFIEIKWLTTYCYVHQCLYCHVFIKDWLWVLVNWQIILLILMLPVLVTIWQEILTKRKFDEFTLLQH